jgi:tetratricopeptide (TPR) repeat protein
MKRLLLIVMIGLSLIGAGGALAQEDAMGAAPPITVATELFQQAQQALGAEVYDRALLDSSLFILLNPTYSPGYYLRGIIYLQRGESGDTDAALGDINDALRLAVGEFDTPDYRAILYGVRANVWILNEDYDAAFADYELALAEAPTVDTFVSRAYLYIEQQDFVSALSDIDAAIELSEDMNTDAALYILRANINTTQMDTVAAGGDYLSYIQLIATDVVEADAIASGDVVPLEMVAGRVYIIPLQLAAGDVFSAIAIADEGSAVDPLLVVLDPEGEPIVGNDDVQQGDLTAYVENISVPTAGVYALVVTHAGGGSDGAMVVSVQLAE